VQLPYRIAKFFDTPVRRGLFVYCCIRLVTIGDMKSDNGILWMERIQKIIFFALTINIILLVAGVVLPFWGIDTPLSVNKPNYYQEKAVVANNGENLFGNIRISSNGVSLEQAYLLINGQKSGNFGNSELVARVYEGDTVEIDAGAYKCQLNFTILAVSSNIDSDSWSKIVQTDGNIVKIADIKFK